MTKYLIGADPELFVVGLDGNPVSAHKMLPGTKNRPHKVDDGAVQIDGMACEFNIDPAETPDQFVSNVVSVMKSMQSMLPDDVSPIPGVASVRFDESVMASQPMAALELGCEPDFDVYTGQPNPRPNAATNLRTAAGHIHLGWVTPGEEVDMFMSEIVVRTMDIFLGVWSLTYDKNVERRTLYGKAGAFRMKPYGVEFRTLSNAWLQSENLMRQVAERSLRVLQMVMEEGYFPDDEICEEAKRIINNSDFEAAAKFVQETDVLLFPNAA